MFSYILDYGGLESTCCFFLFLQVLASNLIEVIPANFGHLRNLKILTLDRNRISMLPEECQFLRTYLSLTMDMKLAECYCTITKIIGVHLGVYNLHLSGQRDITPLYSISIAFLTYPFYFIQWVLCQTFSNFLFLRILYCACLRVQEICAM